MTSKIPVFENVKRDMKSVIKEVRRGGMDRQTPEQKWGCQTTDTMGRLGWDRQKGAEVRGTCRP